MKQNVSETESNWRFQKNVKTCPQNKKDVFKGGSVTAATCKYYCPLFVSPPMTHCCQELHLKCGRVPKSVFENVAMHKKLSGFV